MPWYCVRVKLVVHAVVKHLFSLAFECISGYDNNYGMMLHWPEHLLSPCQFCILCFVPMWLFVCFCLVCCCYSFFYTKVGFCPLSYTHVVIFSLFYTHVGCCFFVIYTHLVFCLCFIHRCFFVLFLFYTYIDYCFSHGFILVLVSVPCFEVFLLLLTIISELCFPGMMVRPILNLLTTAKVGYLPWDCGMHDVSCFNPKSQLCVVNMCTAQFSHPLNQKHWHCWY